MRQLCRAIGPGSFCKMNKDYAFLGLVVSLCLHGALILILSEYEFEMPTPSETVEVEFTDSDEKTKWIVDPIANQEEDISERLKKEAELVSQLTQRVKKQMRAKRGEKTQNASPSQVQIQPKFNYKPDPGEVRPIDPMLKKQAIGYSQFAESIPGIEEGSFNSLNTDQLTYFSFYSRVNNQISSRWVSLVRNYLAGLSPAQIKALAQSDKRTVVEVLLDKDGNYFSSLIHSSSGVQALDEATYKAFRAAAPFLNPPVGLVQEEDGLIHLYYQFVVVFRPNPMAGGSDF